MKEFILIILFLFGGFITGSLCFSNMRDAIKTGETYNAGIAAIWLMAFADILYHYIAL